MIRPTEVASRSVSQRTDSNYDDYEGEVYFNPSPSVPAMHATFGGGDGQYTHKIVPVVQEPDDVRVSLAFRHLN